MNNAFEVKAKISHYLLGLMLRRRVQVPELAKKLRISQSRILALVNPAVLTLDLEVFITVCNHFNVRININSPK